MVRCRCEDMVQFRRGGWRRVEERVEVNLSAREDVTLGLIVFWMVGHTRAAATHVLHVDDRGFIGAVGIQFPLSCFP